MTGSTVNPLAERAVGKPMSGELETVARFIDLTHAQGARSALESAGVESFLRDENISSLDWGLMPALGGLRLEVREPDLERAREILAPLLSEHQESTDPEEIEHIAASRRRKRLVGVVSFLILLWPVLLGIIIGLFLER